MDVLVLISSRYLVRCSRNSDSWKLILYWLTKKPLFGSSQVFSFLELLDTFQNFIVWSLLMMYKWLLTLGLGICLPCRLSWDSPRWEAAEAGKARASWASMFKWAHFLKLFLSGRIYSEYTRVFIRLRDQSMPSQWDWMAQSSGWWIHTNL